MDVRGVLIECRLALVIYVVLGDHVPFELIAVAFLPGEVSGVGELVEACVKAGCIGEGLPLFIDLSNVSGKAVLKCHGPGV